MINIEIENILNSFSSVLESLSEKEKIVIERRVGLNGKRETLQSIGNSFNPTITRERIRQLEDTGIKKIGRIVKTTNLNRIQKLAEEVLIMHGGVLTKDKIVNNILKEIGLDENVNINIIEIIIQSNYDIIKSKPKLGTSTYFHLPTIPKKLIDIVHKETVNILKKKKDVMKTEVLYSMVKYSIEKDFPKVDKVFIDSVLDIFEDIVKGEDVLIGLEKWKILNPKTLKDKAIYVMKKEKKPMHFVEISNKITSYLGDVVKVNTIHNELIRNNEFVLIGRGIYALKEWGFNPGTVLDVICSVIENNNFEPMSTEEIVNTVLKIRNVKKTTIYMNLQNKKVIERVGRNYYQLKNKKAID